MEEKTTIEEVYKVDCGYDISTSNSNCFYLLNKNNKHNIIPKKGDDIIIYTINGSTIRGITINNIKVFYDSDLKINKNHQKAVLKIKKDRDDSFNKNKHKLDEQYNNLPKCFQERIDTFRKNNEKFRVEYESYELFCCSEAVIIADTLKTLEKIEDFSINNNKWEKVPNLDKGHSGNTLGCSTRLAYWYLKHPDSIKQISGALSPLVGSKEYEEKNKRKKLKK